ncbi:MAG TPA: hypothetical protein VIK91_04485, partial [Nannocystis sp.]
MVKFFADDGKGALRRAIEAFEAKSAAELVIAVRPASARWAHAPVLVGAAAAMLTLAFMLYGEPAFGIPWFLIDPLLAGIVVGWLARRSELLARVLTPRAWREEAVQRAARASFLDHGVHETRGRTGVFVYISMTERAAVVLADLGVRREVPREPWERAAAALSRTVAAGGRAVDLVPHLA